MHVTEIASAAEAADGTSPLDEATLLTLAHHPERVRTWTRDGGFALVIGDELTLVVHPDHRNHRIGTALLDDVLADTTTALSAWSHTDHPAAARLARSHGFENVRALWVMRRDLTGPLPEMDVPDGIEIRGFRPGDEDEVVRVNAAAFVDHPEQGAMDRANLAQRMAQPWFDPEGLLLATRQGNDHTLLGLHWTKHHPDAFGEVYVVGIDPAAQGGGLGKVLTLAGLHHLKQRGATEVILYVESDNAPAIAVYSRLGFGHSASDTHVMYRRAL
ncbi:mycothiol synthase [Nocardioides ginsengisegetis]|uniref:Mycothiol acetyltransferase n=1 Tax=Nocardioides ginsengisegetis TaxID=661491 RepID=A0A7W3P7R8_9ACTN|nr:mycothiol synthase [Nocardioides ginsengisegetis]